MFVILASPRDAVAKELATCWANEGAALLTPEDLSRPGWCFDPIRPAQGTAVIAGRHARVQVIRGVLTRLPAVFATDLPHIVAADRAYVAEEMSAFLLAWLTALRCPVVNVPAPPCLAGPNWRRPQWVHAAVRVGLQGAPRSSDPAAEGDAQKVTVLGRQCIGTVDPSVADRVIRLASLAAVQLIEVQVLGRGNTATFIGADLWPDPTVPDVADALLTYFQEAS